MVKPPLAAPAKGLVANSAPPPEASSVPALVSVPLPLTARVFPFVLALMSPAAWLFTVKPPFPMIPNPWIVLFVLVRVRPPTFCWMIALPAPWDIVTVPPPVRVVLLLRPRIELLAPVVTTIVPLLLIVPLTLRSLLLPLV